MSNHRNLPSIEKILSSNIIQKVISGFGKERVKNRIRSMQAHLRSQKSIPDWATSPEKYALQIESDLSLSAYQRVFNLTGTVIHTNLGRSPLDSEILRAIEPLLTNPMSFEYDLSEGKRGNREESVASHLAELCGAEAATIVNNNAAALMLCLNTMCLNKEIPVSRGELIEIGGSFRLPNLIQQAGAKLKEIGTTNRTHLSDYEDAINAETTMLLKIHPSNYHIEGFTQTVQISKLSKLCADKDIKLFVDLGSSTVINLDSLGLPHEITPREAIKQGADIVMFSGDKLLGSVQAGLIVGRRDLIDKISRNPIKRALRADKFTLTYLSETLLRYERETPMQNNIPLLKTLTTPLSELESRANLMKKKLVSICEGFKFEITDSHVQIGSGALPEKLIRSKAIKISHTDSSFIRKLNKELRQLPIPVVTRTKGGELILDMIGANPLPELLDNIEELK